MAVFCQMDGQIQNLLGYAFLKISAQSVESLPISCLGDEYERYSQAFKSIDADGSGEISVQGNPLIRKF